MNRIGLIWWHVLGVCLLTVIPAIAQPPDEQPWDPQGADVVAEEGMPVEPPPGDAQEPPVVQNNAQPAPPPPPQPEAEPAPPPEEPAPLMPTVPQPARPVRPVRPMPVRPKTPIPSGSSMTMPGASKGAAAGVSMMSTGPEPKDGQKAQEATSFDFDNQPLATVIQQIARITGKNFDIDPNIGAIPVTVITHDKIPPDMAYQVLESILSSRGFSLMETLDGHLVKVVKTGDFIEKSRFGEGAQTPDGEFDTLATHVVSIKYADAQDVATIARALGSASLRVDAYLPTNTLVITDTTDGLKRIFSFLEQVDVPGFDTTMEIFTLEYTRAEVLAGQLQQVLTGEGGSSPGAGGGAAQALAAQRSIRPTRPTVPGASGPVMIGSKEEVLRIVPDERLNALIVVATDKMMERVRDLVVRLDTPTPYEANNMHVYELLNANAEDVESALNELVGTAPRQGNQQNQAQSGEIQPFEKKVMIKRYEQTNALLILASPQDYKLIREIIARLDVPVRQVHLEAMVLKVGITDQYSLNVETAGFQENDYGFMGINNVVNLANMLTGGGNPLALADKTGKVEGTRIAYLDGTTTVKTLNTDGEFVEVTIPNVPFLLSAIDTISDYDVVSRPSLTTRDNETANIVVGSEVPVPTMRSGYSYGGTTSTSRPNYNTYSGLTSYGRGIEREDVGVKMTVTPHINEGDYVSAEIEIEVSSIADSGDIDVNELGPTFNKSQVKNNVVAKDGSTAIIAGLITENMTHGSTRMPYLGDVPGLGFLFRSKNSQRTKENLVMLLTPHIIKEGVELDRLTEYRMSEFREANVDALFEKGFIKRMKKRHYMRHKYHPAIEQGNIMDEGGQFGRGDVER